MCVDASKFFGPELISDDLKDCGNCCCGQMSSHFCLFWGKNRHPVLSPKNKRDNTEFHQQNLANKQTSAMVLGCISTNCMGDLHACECAAVVGACIGFIHKQ